MVIIKLDPMAIVLDNAKARPIYLSSSMTNDRDVEGGKGCVRSVSRRECV